MNKKFLIIFFVLKIFVPKVFAQTNNDYYIYKYGVDLFNSKDYNLAMKQFEKYLFVYSEGDYALNCYDYLYKIALVEKNYTQAIKYLKTIIKLFVETSELSTYYRKLGDIYFHLGCFEKALQYYNYIILKFSDTFDAEYAQSKIEQIIFLTSEEK
jgi:TolA-binding protein